MDRYRAILNTIDGEVVADMVKGVCAGYYLADDVDKRIAELEAQLDAYKDFAERVCRGDVGNTIMFEKIVMKTLEKDGE